MFLSIVDSDFCKNHYEKKPPRTEIIDSEDRIKWNDVLEFILLKSDTILLTKQEQRNEDLSTTNPIFFKLLNDFFNNKRPNIQKSNTLSKDQISIDKYYSIFQFNDSFEFSDDINMVINFSYTSESVISSWLLKPATFSARLKAKHKVIHDYRELPRSLMHKSRMIFIIDRYFLKEKGKIEKNIKSLFGSIFEKVENINLVIFSSFSDIDQVFKEDENVIATFIRNQLNEYKNIEVKIFLDRRKRDCQDKKSGKDFTIFHREHERYIFTNLFLINSGQGFSILKEDGSFLISTGTELHFTPVYYSDNILIMKNILIALKGILNSRGNKEHDNSKILECNFWSICK